MCGAGTSNANANESESESEGLNDSLGVSVEDQAVMVADPPRVRKREMYLRETTMGKRKRKKLRLFPHWAVLVLDL